jgi:hypothetical protein
VPQYSSIDRRGGPSGFHVVGRCPKTTLDRRYRHLCKATVINKKLLAGCLQVRFELCTMEGGGEGYPAWKMKTDDDR